MIETNTVFIIGAGGSKPYNFPTGRELRKNIVTQFEKNFSNYKDPQNSEITKIIKTSTSFIHRFDASGIHSIDKFLSFNPGHSYNGKIAIAFEILRAESQSKFLEEMNKSNQNYDWYSFLYNRMLEGVPPGESNYEQFAQNKISFITFNYDRSFEWFLYNCFSNTFNERLFASKPTAQLFPFQFIHVYGASKLPWQSHSDGNDALDYQIGIGFNNISYYDVKKMAESLRIIPEDRSKNSDLSKITQVISNAERIFFLGFGYADENLQKLGIPESIADKLVFGTVKGLTETETKRILHKLRSNKKNSNNKIIPAKGGLHKFGATLLNVDCLTLLREFL